MVTIVILMLTLAHVQTCGKVGPYSLRYLTHVVSMVETDIKFSSAGGIPLINPCGITYTQARHLSFFGSQSPPHSFTIGS